MCIADGDMFWHVITVMYAGADINKCLHEYMCIRIWKYRGKEAGTLEGEQLFGISWSRFFFFFFIVILLQVSQFSPVILPCPTPFSPIRAKLIWYYASFKTQKNLEQMFS